MNRETVFAKLETITSLPTLPAIMNRLNAAVLDPNTNADHIAKIIKDDPSMMARILKVVNSAAYAADEPVTSINLAVARMGFVAVKNIAMSTAVFSTFDRKGANDFDREEFWRHSVCVGIGAYVLYQRVQESCSTVKIPKDVMHLSGLLHDIGKIIFENFFHGDFMRSLDLAGEKQLPLFVAEREIFGTDHAEVGAWLAVKWNLAKEVIEVVRWHHEPEKAAEKYLDLTRLCHTANHICNLEKIGNGGDLKAPVFNIGVWKRLGLKVKDIREIVKDVVAESAQSETLMSFMS